MRRAHPLRVVWTPCVDRVLRITVPTDRQFAGWWCRPARGHQVSLVASIVLSVVMGMRFFKGFKFMPAGLMFVLGLVMSLRGLVAINALPAVKARF